MAEKKKMNKGVIAGICFVVVAAIAAIVAVVVINLTKFNIVGSYKISAVLDADGNETQDSLSMLKAFGMDYAIEFKADNTGVFKITMNSDTMGSLVQSLANAFTSEDETVNTGDISSSIPNETNIDFTYDDKKIKMSSSSFSTASEVDYEVKDGAVILNYNGEKMKFTKEQ